VTYKVMGKYRGKTEELDSTTSAKNAHYLEGEYRLAFGRDWTIWVEAHKGS
jgi:hypothetical protein